MAKKLKTDRLSEQWINGYRDMRPLYERHCAKIQTLLEELLASAKIPYHVIESRAKTVESFAEKIRREGKRYSDPMAEITDLAGVRIILYYTDDVMTVSDVIDREFLVDSERSVDKKATLAPDQFGYLSVHKVGYISHSRAHLTEWADSATLLAEIQIRTVLQHSWAAISHALQYKHEADVPDEFRRRLTRLSGLLELADEEFASLRKQKNILRKDIAEKVSEGNLDIGIDALSISEFIRTAPVVKKLARIAEKAGMRVENDPHDDDDLGISQLVRVTQLANIRTIQELQNTLAEVTSKATPFFREFMRLNNAEIIEPVDEEGFVSGSEAHTMAVVLVGYRRSLFDAETMDVQIGWGYGYGKIILAAGLKITAKIPTSRRKKTKR